MKKNKIIYILIGILCFVAMAIGIYAQFFAKGKDKHKIIMPDKSFEQKNEKTQEEIRSQFMNLFNNKLNQSINNQESIKKIYEEKDIIYTYFQKKESNEKYEISVNIPVINIKGAVPQKFNYITQNKFVNEINQIVKKQNKEFMMYEMKYGANINDDILSICIEAKVKEGNKSQQVKIQTYNYNIKTGEEIKFIDLISSKKLVQSEVKNKIQDVIKKEKEKADILVNSQYKVYNRQLDSNIYKLENISNYFLGPQGELYIIFAYGNQKNTSEMDIVLFEFEDKNKTN